MGFFKTLAVLLWPRPETEYERVHLLLRLGRWGRLGAAWSRFGLAAGAALLLTGAEWRVEEEIDCLALTIYFEARGEPRAGREAVAHVVMNRVADPRFPASVCDVVHHSRGEEENCQFSWYCDRLSDRPENRGEWQDALSLARIVYWNGNADPTGGALWYHAAYVKPIWRRKLERTERIGAHIFYRDPVPNEPVSREAGA